MGLSTEELSQIKETLAAGKKPRVVFTESAGQIAGQIGHVVQLDDPSIQEDWILVKFGADILPFPPSDLAMAPRGATAKRVPEPAAPVPAPAEPEFKVVREQVPPARKEKATPPAATPPAATQEKKIVTETDTETEGLTPAQRKPAGAKPAKAKPAPSFTMTVAYTEGEWTVGAVQGAKTLAKPYVIKASDALKMVSMIDVPGVQEAAEAIMSAERAQAHAAAEKLRAELAELEAKLAELGGA